MMSGSSLQSFLYLSSSVAVSGAVGAYVPYALRGKPVEICVRAQGLSPISSNLVPPAEQMRSAQL